MSQPSPSKRKHKTQKPVLSVQEIRFAQLLFSRGKKSVADCYIEAGFPAKKTHNATEVAAGRLVRKHQFREYYRELQDRAADAAQIDADMIVQGLKRLAFADRRKFYDKNGCILLPHQWPDDVAATYEGGDSKQLFEKIEEVDPETGKKTRRKVLRGHFVKLRTSKRGEALKALAQIKRLIGPESEPPGKAPDTFDVGGDTSSEKL